MKDPNRLKKVKPVIAKPQPATAEMLSRVLNVQCHKTGQLVNINEYLKVYDKQNALIGIGKYTWNNLYKRFELEMNEKMSNQIGQPVPEIDIPYDLFDLVEKLNMDELNEIVMPNL